VECVNEGDSEKIKKKFSNFEKKYFT